MAVTGTVIAGLIYRDGVLIGTDSQASDPQPGTLHIGVRWPVSKLRRVGNHPLVAGFSGQTGTADRLFAALNAAVLRPNQFRRRDLARDALDRIYRPEYEAAAQRSLPPQGQLPIYVHGLAAMWTGEGPGLLEHEMNGDSSFHQFFHAIGSGKPTAYAAYRALGGRHLCRLGEATAIDALLRILQTAISVDMAFVAEPLSLWRIDARGAFEYGQVELDHHRESVALWEARDRAGLFASAGIEPPDPDSPAR